MTYGFNNNLKNVLTSILLAASCALLSPTVQAINVQNATIVSTTDMENALTGSNVTIKNLTITNPGGCTANVGVGIFTNGTTPIGAGPVLSEPTGVIVSSSDFSNATNAINTANSDNNTTLALCGGTVSDSDMVTLEGGTVNGEYSAIEFDVDVPLASTTLAIPFQFGSEEFPEYVCTIYTDIVGIFVSGPGITSTAPVFSSPTPGFPYENYAKTAGGDLSSINWLNTGVIGQAAGGDDTLCTGGNGSFFNSAFYTDNSNGNLTGGDGAVALTNANIESDGFTNTLFQPIPVIGGSTYHVKIAVADTQDRTYDSTAFIHPLFSAGVFLGFDYGDAPDTYGTLTSNGGPSHGIDTTIFMGTVPDNEITGIPTVGADGDDNDQVPDDEDGVASFPVLLSSTTDYSVTVNVTNNSGASARLVGWIDFDGNGTFEAGEGVFTDVVTGTTGSNVVLNWSSLTGLVTGDTYARIRFSTDIDLSINTPGSAMSDGEVEDYALPIVGLEFDKYASTDANCADMLDDITVPVGTDVYYCYRVHNPNLSTAFDITATSDSQGHDISFLEQTYAAGGPDQEVIIPFTAGGAALPSGNTVVNNASVTADFSGSVVVVNESASITINAGVPASGTKRLYFDFAVNGVAGDLTRDPTDLIADAISANIDGIGGTFILDQGDLFVAPFTITGGTNATVELNVRKRRNNGTIFNVELFHFDGVTATPIGNIDATVTAARNVWQTLTLDIAVAADVNFVIGESVRVVVTNTTAGNVNRRIQIRTENGASKSQVRMETGTVINVDSIVIDNNATGLNFSSYEAGTQVSIQATVSDPFGFEDITSAAITITDPGPTAIVTDLDMGAEISSTASTKTYEYIYDIPADPAPDGFWDISVTAIEGYESAADEVSHTLLETLVVGLPDIQLTKEAFVVDDPINDDNWKAIPGATVEYTITAKNIDYGYIDDGTFIIDDPVPAGTRLYLGPPGDTVTYADGTDPGQTASGLTFTFIDINSTLDDVEFYNNSGTTIVNTPTVDGDGVDATSPRIDLIRILPGSEFNGSNLVDDPTAIFKFKVVVD